MKKFSKLDKYSDDELIIIVFIENIEWQEVAVAYAKQLLLDRNITDEYARNRIKEIEIESIELWNRELEERKVESYGIVELILIPLFWFNYILKDWYLAKEGYSKMRKQRLIAIGVGILFYGLIIVEATHASKERDQQRINEIRQLNIADSIALAKTDWSGTYYFIDRNNKTEKKFVWTLIVKKNNQNHIATLTIASDKRKDIIKTQGVIKNEEIEFYPDSTYQLNGKELIYYDRLFTLIRTNDEILTYWGKLKPFMLQDNDELGNYFKNK